MVELAGGMARTPAPRAASRSAAGQSATCGSFRPIGGPFRGWGPRVARNTGSCSKRALPQRDRLVIRTAGRSGGVRTGGRGRGLRGRNRRGAHALSSDRRSLTRRRCAAKGRLAAAAGRCHAAPAVRYLQGVTSNFSAAARPSVVSCPLTLTVTMPASARLATTRPETPSGKPQLLRKRKNSGDWSTTRVR